MARLPFPDVPPGPLRVLIKELHRLHGRAGWPSVRDLASGERFSHTAVHELFTKSAGSPKLPVLLAVVDKLAKLAPRVDSEEVLDQFDAMWQAAEEWTSDNIERSSNERLSRVLDRPPQLRLPISWGVLHRERSQTPPGSDLGRALNRMIRRSGLDIDEVAAQSNTLASSTADDKTSEHRAVSITARALERIIRGQQIPTESELGIVFQVCGIPPDKIDSFLKALRVS